MSRNMRPKAVASQTAARGKEKTALLAGCQGVGEGCAKLPVAKGVAAEDRPEARCLCMLLI